MRISDWSSDVCSSDLAGIHQDCPPIAPHVVELRFEVAHHAVEMFVSHRGGDRALYLLFRLRDAGRLRLLPLLDMLVWVAICLFGGLEALRHPVAFLFPEFACVVALLGLPVDAGCFAPCVFRLSRSVGALSRWFV